MRIVTSTLLMTVLVATLVACDASEADSQRPTVPERTIDADVRTLRFDIPGMT